MQETQPWFSVYCVKCRGFFGWTQAKLGDYMTVDSICFPVSVLYLPSNGERVQCRNCGETNLGIDYTISHQHPQPQPGQPSGSGRGDGTP